MIPDKPCDIPGFEKFKEWRANQKEIIERILNSDKKFIVANLPTGAGKSVIAVASSVLGFNKSYICTYTKQLQDQYLRDFPFVRTIKGRGNYECLQFSGLTAEDCVRKVNGCDFVDYCPYNKAKEAVERAKVAIFNNAYYLNVMNYTDFRKSEFVVFDEAHLLENSLMSFIEVVLSKDKLDKLGLMFPTSSDDVFGYLNELEREVNEYIEEYYGELKLAVEDGDEFFVKKISKVLSQYKSLGRKISFLLSNLDDTWVIDYTPVKVSFKPVFVDNFSRFLFDHADKFLLMSATITMKTVECLGLNKEDVEFIEVEHTFPVKNRPLVFIPKVNMSYKNQEKALPILIKLIKKVLDKHSNERGVIHTSSNRLAKYIVDHVGSDRLLLAIGKDKERMLKLHEERVGSVIVSSAMSEGVDFKYDSARFQIIVNLPFPSLSDERVKKRVKVDKSWYINQMSNKIVQMYGRGTRAIDDYAVTYIFDSRLLYYLKKYKDHFPNWFIEAIKIKGDVYE